MALVNLTEDQVIIPTVAPGYYVEDGRQFPIQVVSDSYAAGWGSFLIISDGRQFPIHVVSDSYAAGWGSFFIISGFYVGLINLLVLVIYAKNKWLIREASFVPEFALLMGDLCVSGLHPFTGSSAIANKWVWGDIGCQLYSFSGFLFGDFLLASVGFVAADRYITTCRPSFCRGNRRGLYWKIFVGLFLMSLVFAVAPLVGWGRYELVPPYTICTLTWTTASPAMVSYFTALMMVFGAAPMGVACVSYLAVHSAVTEVNGPKLSWAPKGHEGKVMLGCAFLGQFSYSIYSVVFLWAWSDDPRAVPPELGLLPPVLVKWTGVFHSIFYFYLNPKLTNCFRKMVGMAYDDSYFPKAQRRGSNKDQGTLTTFRLEGKSPKPTHSESRTPFVQIEEGDAPVLA